MQLPPKAFRVGKCPHQPEQLDSQRLNRISGMSKDYSPPGKRRAAGKGKLPPRASRDTAPNPLGWCSFLLMHRHSAWQGDSLDTLLVSDPRNIERRAFTPLGVKQLLGLFFLLFLFFFFFLFKYKAQFPHS